GDRSTFNHAFKSTRKTCLDATEPFCAHISLNLMKEDVMRAMVLENFGGVDQLKMSDLNIPSPKAGEVQIKIAYTAVNPVDWKTRMGLLQNRMPHEFPIILGWDASGIISAIGEGVTKFKIGDRVFAYCRKDKVHDGTYAEYICVD